MIASSPETALTETPGLIRALRVVRERWWLVPICAAVCFAVAFLYAHHKTKEYTATAKLQFIPNTLPSQIGGVQANLSSADPEGYKSTNVQLVTTIPVAQLVIKALKLARNPPQLLGEVSASSPQNDYIVDVSVTDQSPNEAATIANAFAQQYVVYSQQQNEAQLIRGEQLIDQKYAQLPANDSADRANLRSLYQKLLLLQAVQTGNAQVVDTATPPSSPSSPKTKSIAIVALVLGLLVGIGLTFLLNLLDRRVKSWEEFEEIYGVPALASIPSLPRRQLVSGEQEAALEPFRILHNSLSVLRSSHQVKTVLVTSAVPGEGKTTVALGLARAAALAGQQVILVEADLRRPTLEQQLSREGPLPHPGQHGLISVLLEGTDPLSLLQSPIPGLERLKVLFGGTSEHTTTNILGTAGLGRVFDLLASHADLVVIDSAPMLPVVDTRVLLDEIAIDASLIVARVGSITRQEARRVRSVFERRQLVGVGLVINALSEATHTDYYGYGYGIVQETPEATSLSQERSDRPDSSSLGRPAHMQTFTDANDTSATIHNGASAVYR
jgi:succinoglycan biosynthesis transport protein ExoP